MPHHFCTSAGVLDSLFPPHRAPTVVSPLRKFARPAPTPRYNNTPENCVQTTPPDTSAQIVHEPPGPIPATLICNLQSTISTITLLGTVPGSSTSAIDTHAPVCVTVHIDGQQSNQHHTSSTYPSGHPVDCLVHPPTNSSDCKALSTEARAFWARSAAHKGTHTHMHTSTQNCLLLHPPASTCPACIGYPARGSRSPGALAAIARSPSTISPTSGRPVTSFRLQASRPNCTWLPQTTHNTEHKGRNGGKTHRTHTKRAQ